MREPTVGRIGSALIAVTSVLLAAGAAEARRFRIPKDTRQLVVVESGEWGAFTARLERWARDAKGRWALVGEPAAVVLGKGGLGWGLGEHPAGALFERQGPLKQEGDGRSPAGVFRFLLATGYAAEPPAGTRLEYRSAGEKLHCVDDPKSDEYNRLVEEPPGARFSSAEPMRRKDDLYRWTLVVGHNQRPVKGQGSCIFFHLWRDEKSPTVGCTAMPEALLLTLLGWLDPEAKPLLVQLPAKERKLAAREWGVPLSAP